MNYLSHLRGFKLRRAENPLNTQELALYFILCESVSYTHLTLPTILRV